MPRMGQTRLRGCPAWAFLAFKRNLMVEKALVVQRFVYDFVNEQTGERVEGCRLSYVAQSCLEENGRRGHEVVEVGGDVRVASQVGDVPGVYELDLALRGRGQNQKLRCTGARLVRGVDLETVIANAA